MKSLSVRSLDSATLGALFVFCVAMIFSFALMPHRASAAAVAVSALTATSTPAYANPGLATTTRAKVGDTIQYQLTLTGGAPLVAPQINILSTGSTTMSGSDVNWFYATTTTSNASVWNDGLVTFKISVGQDTLVETATTTVTALTSGSNITFDKTAPTLSSVAWTDTDSSTQFSATDTLLLTFSETMATTTLTGANLDTVLGLTNSHTFSTTTAPTWNTAGTQLTITLGAGTTITGLDTVQPTIAVKDAIGNTSSGAETAIALPDTTAPGTPTGLTDNTTFSDPVTVSLASAGSTVIRYATGSTVPTCSTGTLYSSAITVSATQRLTVIACDEASNASAVATAVYTQSSGGSGGGSSHSSAAPAVPATKIEACKPGDKFNGLTGKSCTISATPAVSAHKFSGDLKAGSRMDDVRMLQVFLNSHGYTIAISGPGSAGSETTTFGSLTKAALAKYQKAKGITPAVGYFGPITRAAVNAED